MIRSEHVVGASASVRIFSSGVHKTPTAARKMTFVFDAVFFPRSAKG